jgi:hypothetical protein
MEYATLSSEQMEGLMALMFLEMETGKVFLTVDDLILDMKEKMKEETEVDPDILFYYEAIQKRVNALGFKLRFTLPAFLSFGVFADRIGAVILMLIDILEKLGENDISLGDIATRLYPMGFYSEEGLWKRIDEIQADKAKPEGERKFKYSYVY